MEALEIKKNEVECLKEWVFACCDVSVGKV
jgi:hypothetical protein